MTVAAFSTIHWFPNFDEFEKHVSWLYKHEVPVIALKNMETPLTQYRLQGPKGLYLESEHVRRWERGYRDVTLRPTLEFTCGRQYIVKDTDVIDLERGEDSKEKIFLGIDYERYRELMAAYVGLPQASSSQSLPGPEAQRSGVEQKRRSWTI